ncbi:MAG: DUF1294 domain-containing protein [Hominenteromicrobium sp.]
MPESIRTVLAVWFAAINLFAAAAACIDKRRAIRGKWRIPERTLLLLGFFGGAAGELIAMLLIRHKTRHPKFMVLLPLFCLLHAALLIRLTLTIA